MTASATKRIVDRYGQPISYSDFYRASNPAFRSEMPPRASQSNYDTKDLLSDLTWAQMLSLARWFFVNSPIIRGALQEQARYSFPIRARYFGRDKAWGDKADDFLISWNENPTLRGGIDRQTLSRIRMLGYKIDGDFTTVFTKDEDGMPKLQCIRAHRIASMPYGFGYGMAALQEVRRGPYNGKKICNGIIHDDYGRHVAIYIPGNSEELDQYVNNGSYVMTYDPNYSDQVRGITHFDAVIRTLATRDNLRVAESRAMEIQSRYAITERNEIGREDPREEAMLNGLTSPEGSEIKTKTLDAGLIKYFKGGTGSGLDFHKPDRPGQDWQMYENSITRDALYGIDWDADFALALKEPGGAWARTILEKINRATKRNAEIEARAQLRENIFALSVAIESGFLPAPSDGDISNWGFESARKDITADAGYDAQQDRDGYKLGFTTLLRVAAKNGDYWQDVRTQLQTEALDQVKRAKEIQALHPELTLAQCLDMISMRQPNGAQTSPSPTIVKKEE